MATIQSRADWERELSDLQADFQCELAERKRGVPGLGEPFELELVLRDLAGLAARNATRPLPANPQRQLDAGGLIHMGVDNWPWTDPLANRMMEICDYYLNHLT